MGCGASTMSTIKPLVNQRAHTDVVVIEPVVIERSPKAMFKSKSHIIEIMPDNGKKQPIDLLASTALSANINSNYQLANSININIPVTDEYSPRFHADTTNKHIRINSHLPRSSSHRLAEPLINLRTPIQRISEAPQEEGSLRLRVVQSSRDSNRPVQNFKKTRKEGTRNLLSEIEHKNELISVKESCHNSIADGCATPTRLVPSGSKIFRAWQISKPLKKSPSDYNGFIARCVRVNSGVDTVNRYDDEFESPVQTKNSKISAIHKFSKYQSMTPKIGGAFKTFSRKLSSMKINGFGRKETIDDIDEQEALSNNYNQIERRSISRSCSRSDSREAIIRFKVRHPSIINQSIVPVKEQSKETLNNITKRTENNRPNSSRAILQAGNSHLMESFRIPLDESKTKRFVKAADNSSNLLNLNSSSNLAGGLVRKHEQFMRIKEAPLLGSGGDISLIDQPVQDFSNPIIDLMRIDDSFESLSEKQMTIDLNSIRSRGKELLSVEAADSPSSFVSRKLRSSVRLLNQGLPTLSDANQEPDFIRSRITSLGKAAELATSDKWLRKKPRNLGIEPQDQ